MTTRPTFLTNTVALVCFACSLSTHAAVRYVDVNNTNPTPPYLTWTTATTVIQDAVDVALAGDEILVTNGVYQTGGRAVYPGMTNRVAVTKPLTLRSVNGPDVTAIKGYQVPGTTNGDGAVRCVYLTNGAALVGFTLTNGASRTSGDLDREQSGGGAWCESTNAVLMSCLLLGNSAYSGGGAYYGTLKSCALNSNVAYQGGGTFNCALNNCTLSGNSACLGGGANASTLNNCIIYYNAATLAGDNYYASTLNYCCTTPLPPGGKG